MQIVITLLQCGSHFFTRGMWYSYVLVYVSSYSGFIYEGGMFPQLVLVNLYSVYKQENYIVSKGAKIRNRYNQVPQRSFP